MSKREHVTTDSEWSDAFHEWGWEAARKRKPLSSNPYPEGSRARPLWEAGWLSYQKRHIWWPGRRTL